MITAEGIVIRFIPSSRKKRRGKGKKWACHTCRKGGDKNPASSEILIHGQTILCSPLPSVGPSEIRNEGL